MLKISVFKLKNVDIGQNLTEKRKQNKTRKESLLFFFFKPAQKPKNHEIYILILIQMFDLIQIKCYFWTFSGKRVL